MTDRPFTWCDWFCLTPTGSHVVQWSVAPRPYKHTLRVWLNHGRRREPYLTGDLQIP